MLLISLVMQLCIICFSIANLYTIKLATPQVKHRPSYVTQYSSMCSRFYSVTVETAALVLGRGWERFTVHFVRGPGAALFCCKVEHMLACRGLNNSYLEASENKRLPSQHQRSPCLACCVHRACSAVAYSMCGWWSSDKTSTSMENALFIPYLCHIIPPKVVHLMS